MEAIEKYFKQISDLNGRDVIKVTMLIMLFNSSYCENQQLYYRLTVLWKSKKLTTHAINERRIITIDVSSQRVDIQVTKVKDYNLLACSVGTNYILTLDSHYLQAMCILERSETVLDLCELCN